MSDVVAGSDVNHRMRIADLREGRLHGRLACVKVVFSTFFNVYSLFSGRRVEVIYIGKPLPPRQLSKRQMLGKMAKYAVKALFIGSKSDLEKARAYSSAGASRDGASTSSAMEPMDFETYNPAEAESFIPSTPMHDSFGDSNASFNLDTSMASEMGSGKF